MKYVRHEGFTLIELLVGITLLGLILTLLFSGLRLGSRAWDVGETRVEEASQIRAVESLLRQELSRIFPYRWKKANGRLAFVGDPNVVWFVGFLPAHAGGGGLNMLALELEMVNETWRMKLKYLPLDSEANDFSVLDRGEEVVLADGIRADGLEKVAFSYYGAETELEQPRWLDHWANEKRLPLLIRLRGHLSGGREWPDLVVAPMLSSDQH